MTYLLPVRTRLSITLMAVLVVLGATSAPSWAKASATRTKNTSFLVDAPWVQGEWASLPMVPVLRYRPLRPGQLYAVGHLQRTMATKHNWKKVGSIGVHPSEATMCV